MRIDAGTRTKLLNAAEQLGQDFIETAERRLKNFGYSDPVGEKLPGFVPPPRQHQAQPTRATLCENTLTIEALFQRWKVAHAEKRTPSTF